MQRVPELSNHTESTHLHTQLSRDNSSKLISFLQTFGIILVVLGHTDIADTWLRTWIYEFHMPLFMFISGYLMKYSLKTGYKDINLGNFIKKKSYRLLIPYLVISTIALFPKILMNNFTVRPIEVSWVGIMQSYIYPWDNAIIFFWFLPTLFITLIFSASLLKLFKSHIPIVILMAISLYCQIFNLPSALVFVLSLGLGVFAPMLIAKFVKANTSNKFLRYVCGV